MNMKRILSFLFVAVTVIATKAQITNGVELTAADMNINVTFYSPDIVRVTKAPLNSKALPQKSEVVTMSPQSSLPISSSSSASTVRLKSTSLTVTVDRRTGLISFASANGKSLLKEKTTAFEQRTQGTDKGRYIVSMTYQLDKDEAIYGLGTVQDGKLNRRGLSKRVEQGNLEDFQNIVQSVKGWGIYWDNYSCSQFDDNAQGMTFKAEVGDCADYYFMYGKNADGVNACIRQLTGDVPMFPLWTYGFWQCR